MSFNIKIINRIAGLLVFFFGLALLPAALIAAVYGEYAQLRAFSATSLACTVAGFFFAKAFRPVESASLKLRDGFIAAPMSLLLVSVLGMLPYVLSGEIPAADAFFESVSGFSTTGATVLANVEIHSKSILFWRSFTQWLGGAGIIIFTVALLPAFEKIAPVIPNAARVLFVLYAGITAMEACLLAMGGFSFYDAAVCAFSTVSTGGFSPSGSYSQLFGSGYVCFVFALFMTVGG
ncbi:MAG: hypothetical protein FWG42_10940, partial [Clostridiales bacterium]|nr:hypothetical protein [Clostridiales bacterium]